ncbi:mediator of RNA polymerase II transcription subunit 13 isoform X1 [Telopea speciosissima]|uniref:mediator of RNA polymerase II transcription subunit 13 isoform X1 n=1 Tax=Telopea speciosissima TaxID=54955 RepID=UPI001CC7DCE1|nr:mediator of RNA polymerase II transcription subunit 13 isoform X1 [Telopea speciosissima]
MWTNVFKIGGLHHISWFQFLPFESDPSTLPEKSVKAQQKDAATLLVLSAHLQLQKEGFLSTWTNSFVGPWDPSQGMHNPDEKIKLWLFLPGRHSSVIESSQAAVSRLRVVGSGLWLAPGDSEEVATALSQALRNCIERAMRGLSYVRFGDVFARCHSFSQSEKLFRRVQPTVEFIFAATEEAIFVHVIISAKHIRTLSGDDMERVLGHLSSKKSGGRLPVIVAPHGMRGRLTGCCPSDLVKQVYFGSSKVRSSNGFPVPGIPLQVQGSGCQLRGQSCYVEVTLGCPGNGSDKEFRSLSNSNGKFSKPHLAEAPAAALGRGDLKQGSSDNSPVLERTFIYPSEAVLVPVMHTIFARSSLKRFWLQNWARTSLFGSSFFMDCLETAGKIESIDGPWSEVNGIHSLHSYNSSSNSNSSSISSISSTSSESDYRTTTGTGDLEADADSLTCKQSDLSSNDQFENDGQKLVSKRPRMGMTDSFVQSGTGIISSMQEAYKSGYNSIEVNNSAIAGVVNDSIGSHWLDDEDRGIGMDIQILLSEFGDFGDFFIDDALPFGEPPGTAESQALMFPVADSGDVSGSPCTVGMDVTDQMFVSGFPSFDGFTAPPPVVMDESQSINQEVIQSAAPGSFSAAPSTSEFDHLSKAEAIMTFAEEYRAVATHATDLPSSIFRSPYMPSSRKLDSSHSTSCVYVYGAMPPPSSCLDVSDEKLSVPANSKADPGGHEASFTQYSNKFYTLVEWGKEKLDGRSLTCNNSAASCEVVTPSSSVSGFSSANAAILFQKKNESTFEAGHLLLSSKTVLATEVECIMFQASMCRMRHMLLSLSTVLPTGLSRLTSSAILDQLPGDPSTTGDKFSSKYEVKKKECIPVRIAGDVDGGILDGPVNAPVGVWRSVGVPKGAKSTNSPSIDNTPSLHHTLFNEEGMVTYSHKQPVEELLDAMALLVQQATSFVDVALDADHGDGVYGWLALQEQCRRGFPCGPSMVHAGCGGVMASCHYLDIAGSELLDPLSADVSASSVISLLQSDIKAALKSAFPNMDGPLSVTDWCRGRSQSGDAGTVCDGYSAESSLSESKDASSAVTLAIGEPISPSQSSTGGSSGPKVSSTTDGARAEETCQRRSNPEICGSETEMQISFPRLRPTLYVLPFPAILVGYQDDWLKTSASSLQLWEKAPFEPYALPKPMTYYVICPDIDPLVSASADFFQQLSTVYETCKLGTHAPQNVGGQLDQASGKGSPCGFVFVDCPQSTKIENSNASIMGSISDYLLSLSNGWELASFLKSLSKVLKALKLGSNLSTNQKDSVSGPCTVIYVVCPFPDPIAILQTVIESSSAIGSVVLSSDKERRSSLHTQVGKALSCSTAVDESSTSNVVTISGCSIPKLVLQIVTVDSVFRVTSPALNELVLLKETAFTVYNKARRISRSSFGDVQSSGISGKPSATLMHMSSIPGMWKDCVPRITGTSLPREGELDSGLRPGAWDNSWQSSRGGGLGCDPNRSGDFLLQDDARCLFEPLFILAEPGSVEHGLMPTVFGNETSESTRASTDDSAGAGFMQGSSSVGSMDIGSNSLLDGSESEGCSNQKTASLHCCYGWTEDWRWLVCIWTDSRGELLDSHIFPFGGISSRQDTKGLQCVFVQVLHQACQMISCSSPEVGNAKCRDIVITRIGSFFELECQEWQKAIYLVGGNEVKKWPLQLRRSSPDGIPTSSSGTSLQQQEMSFQERTLPSSPSPLYSPHTKASTYMKGVLGQNNTRKQLMGGQMSVDSSRGLFQWVQSISLVGVSLDHSLHLVFHADISSPGGGAQGGSSIAPSSYLEGFSPVKSLGSTSATYILIPSPSMRYLSPMPLQLPTCLTAESPPLAHLLHSKGSAIPLCTGFVVSKAVASIRKDSRSSSKDEWPSVLSVSLVDYYGSNNIIREKIARGSIKHGRSLSSEGRDFEIESHLILESVAAELQALSWMTASPTYLDRRTALPFHCDMLLRLRRLLHYADKELSQQSEKS